MPAKKILVLCLSFFLLMVCVSAGTRTVATFDVAEEETAIHHNQLAFASPPPPLRQPAEFEPMQAVLIRYPFGISYELIAEMSEDIEVITIVASSSQQTTVTNQYQSNGVNLNHCSFLLAPSNTYWTRDYGPWFAFTDDDELSVIDFTYSRGYRPDDDNIPFMFAADQTLSYFFMPLYHEGGNYMTDGYGTSVSTDLVLSVNPGLTVSEIRQIAQQYLGVDTYHIIPDVNGEYIKHVDCWGKYLAPDVILIREVPVSHSQYNLIEAAVDYFESQISCYGTPYQVVRVYTPNNEPYTNSLILNKKVFVPMKGTSWDAAAIASYQNAMPGYEILGFTALQSNPWYSTDALHCRTIGIPDRFMLYIDHTPLRGNQTSENGYQIEAKIYPYSDQPLIGTSTGVYWSIGSGDWNFIQMQPLGNHYYHAVIPAQQNGTLVSYYIHAEDGSGREEDHPYIGKADAHFFTAYGDVPQNTPPETPQRPSGQSSGKVGVTYLYSTLTTDVDGDLVLYRWDWGDGSFSDWLGPFPSGETATVQHSWSAKGTYSVRVKAQDSIGDESDWSEPLVVSMPRLSFGRDMFFQRLWRLFSDFFMLFS